MTTTTTDQVTVDATTFNEALDGIGDLIAHLDAESQSTDEEDRQDAERAADYWRGVCDRLLSAKRGRLEQWVRENCDPEEPPAGLVVDMRKADDTTTVTEPTVHAILTWIRQGPHVPESMHARVTLGPLEVALIKKGVITSGDLCDAYRGEIEAGRFTDYKPLPVADWPDQPEPSRVSCCFCSPGPEDPAHDRHSVCPKCMNDSFDAGAYPHCRVHPDHPVIR